MPSLFSLSLSSLPIRQRTHLCQRNTRDFLEDCKLVCARNSTFVLTMGNRRYRSLLCYSKYREVGTIHGIAASQGYPKTSQAEASIGFPLPRPNDLQTSDKDNYRQRCAVRKHFPMCKRTKRHRDKKEETTKRTMAGPASSKQKYVHLTIPSLSGFDFWYLPCKPLRVCERNIHSTTHIDKNSQQPIEPALTRPRV
jgi:hypothetical protein